MHMDSKVQRRTYAEAVLTGLPRVPLPRMGSAVDPVAIGREQKSQAAKANLKTRAADFVRVVVEEVNVDPKYHHRFVHNRAQQIKKISEENGGVQISFPRFGSKSSEVSLRGAKKFVDTAKAAILEAVADIESQAVVQCIIPRKHHGRVIGASGQNVQSLSKEYSVFIEFPRTAVSTVPRRETGTTGRGDDNEASAIKDTTDPRDVVLITGKEENCLRAKEALLDLVPGNFAVNVPLKFHSAIIGPRGRNIDSMCKRYGVLMKVPPREKARDCVYVIGPVPRCERAMKAVLEQVKDLEEEAEGKELVEIVVEVPFRFQRAIIGQSGENKRSLCKQHGVWIITRSPKLDKGWFLVQGPAKNCEEAKEALLKRAKELQDEEDGRLRSRGEGLGVFPEHLVPDEIAVEMPCHPNSVPLVENTVEESEEDTSVEVDIDYRARAILFKHGGKTIAKFRNHYKVGVHFPRKHHRFDQLTITGKKKNVEDAKLHILVRWHADD